MSIITKGIDKIDKVLVYISATTIMIMMLWIFSDVFSRTVFNRPIGGTIEITGEYFLVIIVYFSLSYTQGQRGHVNVEFLQEKFSKTVKIITQLISNMLGVIVFTLLGFSNFEKSLSFFARDTRSPGVLEYPLGPALMIISFGVLILSLRLIIDSINIIKDKRL